MLYNILMYTSLRPQSEGGGNTSSLPKNARARGVQAMAVDPETTTLSEGGVRRVFTTSSIGFIITRRLDRGRGLFL